MLSYKVARRSFLRGCGGSAALLGPLLRSIEARAQGMPAPLRFLVVRHACGSPLELWRPADAATTTSFVLPVNTAAFAPLQSKMVLIDGLNIVPASRLPGNSGGQFSSEGGTVALMTGVPTLGQIGQQDHCAGGASIDQVFLDRSPILGGLATPLANRTPIGSLQLAADVRSDRDEIAPRVLSYRPPTGTDASFDAAVLSAARQPMAPETQPVNTYTRLFGQALPPGSDMTAIFNRKRSILDFVRSDLARLNALVPSSERPKLQIHADAIQKLESSLRATLMPRAGATCLVPAMPAFIPATGVEASGTFAPPGGGRLKGFDYYTPGDPTSHPHQLVGRLHLSMITSAFLCDLVRVATFSWSSATSGVVFPGTFDGATLPGSPVASPHYPPLSVDPALDPATIAWGAAIDRFYSDQTAQALQELAAATDVDGGSLLDNTIVVYVCELGRRWDHSLANVPFLVFGGKNTGIKGGTFLKVTGGPLPVQTGAAGPSRTGNRSVNDVWLALAPIFGVDLAGLGSPAQFTGPLPGLVS